MSINLFKTIKEGDSMLDLIKNILSNLNFYLEHMDFLNNIGYSKEELINYKEKLEIVFSLYTSNSIPSWFEKYNAYLLMSGDFPYISPYLDFCFSFNDMIDMVLSINKNLKTKKIVDAYPINSQEMEVHIFTEKSGKMVIKTMNREKWLEFKETLT